MSAPGNDEARVHRAALVGSFAGFPDRLAAHAVAALNLPVAPGEWGPAEVVRHLIAVEREIWHSRLARVTTEDDPHWPWAEPGLGEGFDEASLEAVLAGFGAARATTVATVRALDEDGWARFGTHATYGRLDVEGLLRIAVDHDANHLEGLTRAG